MTHPTMEHAASCKRPLYGFMGDWASHEDIRSGRISF